MSINLLTHQWAQDKKLSCHFYPEISSTNEVAKKEFSSLQNDFALYLADHQTQGKGRDQRVWQNLSGGEVLLSTWCFRLNQNPQPILTPLLGLALYEGLRKQDSSLNLRLKAPNDLLLDDKKLSGLLVEIQQMGNDIEVFVGLGMNVFSHPQVDQPTTSLGQSLENIKTIWPSFCDSLLESFREAMTKGGSETLLDEDRKRILVALNQGLSDEEKILEVSHHCDLTTKAGQISWKDL